MEKQSFVKRVFWKNTLLILSFVYNLSIFDLEACYIISLAKI